MITVVKKPMERLFSRNEEKKSPSDSEFVDDGETLKKGVKRCLYIGGLALPKIDPGGFATGNLESWTLWMDGFGNTVEEKDACKEKCLGFHCQRDKDSLEVSLPGDSRFRKVEELPMPFEGENGKSFELAPSPVPDDYHAILKLPPLLFDPWPLDEKEKEIGRNTDGIRLNLLDIPGSLKWRPGAHGHETLGALGFSRRHAAIRIENESNLMIKVLSEWESVYHIDENDKLVGQPIKREKKNYYIFTREKLLMGCYLLHFQK